MNSPSQSNNERNHRNSQRCEVHGVVWRMSCIQRFISSLLLLALIVTHTATAESPNVEQRRDAATETALLNATCKSIKPFYWEIGDKSASLVSASIGDKYNAETRMLVASASKWLWGAYVVQLKQGILSEEDISFLTMTSGYTHFRYQSCALMSHRNASTTVRDCFTARGIFGGSSKRNVDDIHRFHYDGGHYQKQALELELGDKNYQTLLPELQQQLGDDVIFSFDSPQIAGGINITPGHYAIFLRKILNSQLLMHDALGTYVVCTNPATCSTSTYSPTPSKESWHYSLGHWVEDDPNIGDGAFSSAGAFGFYPWIDHSKTFYGIIARKAGFGAAVGSVNCGRIIRHAWMSGKTQY